MCAIFGIYNINSNVSFNENEVVRCLSLMNHRGPDARGIKLFSNKAALAHSRLSIIDLSNSSNQPFEIDDRYFLTFNGEIYNFVEIREELQRIGYTFRTNGDSEVLLTSYIEWGSSCVSKFNGMWAFSIYDSELNELFCSRDRFGVKPFNYAIVDGQFIFSSEIKSILSYSKNLSIPNYNVIYNYIKTSIGAQLEETWFKDVYRLPPAHNLIINEFGIRKIRYWDYPRKVERNHCVQQSVNEYRTLFEDALRLRMRSDVPVGLTLSSGIDSSSIACVLKQKGEKLLNTYTASFEKTNFLASEKANFGSDIEIDEPTLVSKLTTEIGCIPTFISVNYENYSGRLKNIIWHLESGHGSPAIFPLDQVLECAKKDVTVVLEGQGADELLGGYISSCMPHYLIYLLKKCKFRKAFLELVLFARTYSIITSFKLFIRTSNFSFIKNLFYKFIGVNKLCTGELRNQTSVADYPIKPIGFDDEINEYLYKAHTGGLVNLLHYGDAISMSHSLESRLPFMDYRLVEFVFKLPAEFKIRMGLGKYLHRISMDQVVPGYILHNPIKFGFESPLTHLFSNEDNNGVYGILMSEKFKNRGLFSETVIEKYLKETREGKRDHSRILYRILSVELWFQNFIDNDN
jgi:asparagine synthase (glutamine-hydrolysing)